MAANAKARWLLGVRALQKANQILRMSRNPIIIGGCGRSGTTLVLSVLSCHPRIFAINDETRALSPGTRHKAIPGEPFKMDRIYQYLLDSPVTKAQHRWCEKTPRNVLHYDTILRRFGKGVRIINIVRDGRDVVVSRHPNSPTEYWVEPEMWVEHVTAGMKFATHPQVLTIRMEDLVLDYDATLRKVCSFINEEFVDAFFDYPATAVVKRNVAWYEEARPIDPGVIGKWKKPEHQAVVQQLMNLPAAVELLKHYGYL